MDLVAVYALFVFMLVPLCFCVATVFRRIKIYILAGKKKSSSSCDDGNGALQLYQSPVLKSSASFAHHTGGGRREVAVKERN